MQTLNAELLASRSATATLEKWCREHRLAAPAAVRAIRIGTAAAAPDVEQRRLLQVSPREEVRYRRVELRCGGVLLSVADNWYVPKRLTRAMRQSLDHSDTPFGKVIQPLEPYRRTHFMKLRWTPLPAGWSAPSGEGLSIPAELFEHHAIVCDRKHRPLAAVREVYQKQILGTPSACGAGEC